MSVIYSHKLTGSVGSNAELGGWTTDEKAGIMGLGCTIPNIYILIRTRTETLKSTIKRICSYNRPVFCSRFDKFSNCTFNIPLLSPKKVNVQGSEHQKSDKFFFVIIRYLLSCRSCIELPLT